MFNTAQRLSYSFDQLILSSPSFSISSCALCSMLPAFCPTSFSLVNLLASAFSISNSCRYISSLSNSLCAIFSLCTLRSSSFSISSLSATSNLVSGFNSFSCHTFLSASSLFSAIYLIVSPGFMVFPLLTSHASLFPTLFSAIYSFFMFSGINLASLHLSVCSFYASLVASFRMVYGACSFSSVCSMVFSPMLIQLLNLAICPTVCSMGSPNSFLGLRVPVFSRFATSISFFLLLRSHFSLSFRAFATSLSYFAIKRSGFLFALTPIAHSSFATSFYGLFNMLLLHARASLRFASFACLALPATTMSNTLSLCFLNFPLLANPATTMATTTMPFSLYTSFATSFLFSIPCGANVLAVSPFSNLFSMCTLSSFLSGCSTCCANSSLLTSSSASPFSNFYMTLFSAYLVLPLYSTISFYVLSFDVIHSFGYHSFGFKSDAIPGRVNSVAALSLFVPGLFSSYCYELCGSSHTSMLSSAIVL